MKLLGIILISLLSLSIYSQQTDDQFLVTGSVYDAETHTPLQFVTISLQDISTNDIIGTITNKKGYFEFMVPRGKYNCIVESLSFSPFKINSLDVCQNYEVGVIELNQNFEELDEVEIIAKYKLVDYKFSKKVYYASKDIANVGGNAITVLENTPNIRISEEGSITIRGAGAQVLVNGKPYGGLKSNADILSLIPASSIKSVEILARSAKYDADGGGEVINIILKKGMNEGYNGTIDVYGGIPGNDGINTFLNYKSENVNLYSTVSFNHNVKIKDTEIHQTFLENNGQPTGNFEEEIEDYRQKNSLLFSLGSDFKIDKKNTITASLLFTNSNKNYNSEFLMNDYQPVDHLIKTTERDVKDNSDETYMESYINYTTKFNKEGHQLSFDINYSKSHSENETSIFDEVIFPNDTNDNKKYEKDESINNYFFQIDYTYPFNDNSKLDLGHKTNVRDYQNIFLASNYDPVSQLLNPIISFSNKIKYNEKIYSFYANYNKQLKNISFLVGLRTEISQIKFTEDFENKQYDNDYIDFFPNALFTYTFNNGNAISASYARYIDRPNISQLNPFNSFTDERFIRSGNPYLNPFYTNYFMVEYNHELEKLNLNTAVFYSNSTDTFLRVLEKTDKQTDDGFDIYHSYPINNGNLNYTGIDLSLTYNPIKKIRLYGSITPFHSDLSDTFENQYDYSDFRWYARASFYYSLNNTLRFKVDYAYRSPEKTALTEIDKYQYTNFTASKDLFDNKATLTFKMSDVFHTRKAKYSSTEASSVTYRDVEFRTRYLLTFTYRFNKASKRNANNRAKDIDKNIFEIKDPIQ